MPAPGSRRGRKGLVVAVAVAVLAVVASAGSARPARAGDPASSAARPFKASGHFAIGHQGGRWYFVTPTGQPFYSTGIDHVSSDPDTDRVTGHCPYCDTIAGEYPDTAAWADATVARLRSWGFNSLGPFSDLDTFAGRMPYSVQLGMASGDDWFSPSFAAHADEVAATQVAPRADDPNLIGWYTDSELDWGPNGGDLATQLDHYLALPAGSPGLAVAQQHVGDPNGFVYALATRYFQVTTAAVRRYDPHHLILGVKAEAQEIQPELLRAARPYVDVFSIDDYQLLPGLAQVIDQIWPQYLPVTSNFDDFERQVDRPIMVAEYSFIADTPQTPDTVPGVYDVFADQAARADAYTAYVAPLYEDAPWVVGDEWFEYVDEPAGGRFDGENDDFGVVDVEDQPYDALVSRLQVMHAMAPDRLVDPGPMCDGWAPAPGGATCTAHLDHPSTPAQLFTTSLPSAVVGHRYSSRIVAIGGTPPYTFSLAPGSRLPPGLRLRATGLISGAAKAAGTTTFTVTATDSTPGTPQVASRTETLVVET